MLAPNEWLRGAPDAHIGSYRLEYDGSWTDVAAIPKRDAALDPSLLALTSN